MNPSPREIFLVLGGCRSGKSQAAQEWAEARSSNRMYLATAQVLDDEMVRRVAKHQGERGPGWRTVEEPIDIVEVLLREQNRTGVILVDCLTLWLTNMVLADFTDEAVMDRTRELSGALADLTCPVALVANEVGLGIVPDNPLSRRFRDLAGWINQHMARTADRVVLTVAGLPVRIKG